MKQKNYWMFLIPLVAVVVIIESVVLVSNLSKKEDVEVGKEEVAQVETAEKPVLDLLFGGGTRVLKLGQMAKFDVSLVGREERMIDAIALYVGYDPTAFEASDLTFENDLPKPTFSRVSDKKKVLVVNYLVSDSVGYALKPGGTVELLSFNLTPKKVGDFELAISTGKEDKDSVTMFVETASSKELPFSSNKLTIKVTR